MLSFLSEFAYLYLNFLIFGISLVNFLLYFIYILLNNSYSLASASLQIASFSSWFNLLFLWYFIFLYILNFSIPFMDLFVFIFDNVLKLAWINLICLYLFLSLSKYLFYYLVPSIYFLFLNLVTVLLCFHLKVFPQLFLYYSIFLFSFTKLLSCCFRIINNIVFL